MPWQRWIGPWLLALGMALAAGCGAVQQVKTDLGIGDAVIDESAQYQELIKPYLVKGRIYRNLGTEMLCTALPLNSKVRRARAAMMAKAKAMTPEQVRRHLAEEQKTQERYCEVVLSFYVPDRKSNNLAGLHPDWLVFLVNQKGQRQLPVDRRRIKRRSALNQTLYPFWGLWDRLYILRYKRTIKGRRFIKPTDRQVRMLITGARGRTVLTLPLR